MKKILLIIAIVFAALQFTNAQYKVVGNKTYAAFVGVAGDTLNASNTLNKDFYVYEHEYLYNYIIEAKVDSAGDGGAVTCKLQGGLSRNHFVDIDTIVWALTSSDTTLRFDGSTTNTLYRYLRLNFVGEDGDADMAIPTYSDPIRIRIVKAE